MKDDLISRQAAIDAVNNAFDRETLLAGFVRSIAVKAIRDMPSAQSEPSQVARDIADIIENEMDMRVIARSEIIRCKDCKFYSPMNREAKIGICNLTMHQNFGDIWFCAGAERRTDEGLD